MSWIIFIFTFMLIMLILFFIFSASIYCSLDLYQWECIVQGRQIKKEEGRAGRVAPSTVFHLLPRFVSSSRDGSAAIATISHERFLF